MAILLDELKKFLAANKCTVHNVECQPIVKDGKVRVYYCCDEHGKKIRPEVEQIIKDFQTKKPGLN